MHILMETVVKIPVASTCCLLSNLNRFCLILPNVVLFNILEMVQDRDIVTMEG